MSAPAETGNSPLTLVVGAGGVGKTTLAAAFALRAARQGHTSLVMTFDPSRRLKSALGLRGDDAGGEVRVPVDAPGRLDAALLDARVTFDQLIEQYSPDAAARDRILGNRYYHNLAGHLAGVFEYMAVERLYEIHSASRYERVILDTPPTRNAIDFLDAPARVVEFLDSGLVRFTTRNWFDADGRLRPTRSLGPLGRRIEALLERAVGLGLLRDVVEFFSAFQPLYEGFRERAAAVEELLRAPSTSFVLVTGPGADRIPDTLFFARRLVETGLRLAGIVVNRVHPAAGAAAGSRSSAAGSGADLMRWLSERDADGLSRLTELIADRVPVTSVPILGEEPAGLGGLGRLLDRLEST